ncbi:MAG: 50S ribosomal protein L4 [Melioribacteraceae bacterium]|nr:50S ribosomal protein L4 [Melioribacteraceae bacterium]MCF8354665.1 50S ribosomal protein L4 [Melioribacteraceae bacterium]MCF8393567.1 50S ribosomal protein L4 [Melioribacteraceae bacterium]MCF8419377.1 50S ribosomal protein L4 [Melioribacteraceae bacterium]
MKVDIYKIDGSKSGSQLDLNDDIFGVEPNDHVVYLAVKAHLANKRQGTHKAKERNEVRGGGRKPWRQKGRGTARAGTSRSPIWVGGGRIFGPKPRDYSQKLNKKVSVLARKSALSYKAKAEQIVIVEDFNFDEPKTKDFAKILDALKISGKRALLLTNGTLLNVYKSGRNIPKVNIVEANKASTYDLVNNQVLLLQQSAVEQLVNTLN